MIQIGLKINDVVGSVKTIMILTKSLNLRTKFQTNLAFVS